MGWYSGFGSFNGTERYLFNPFLYLRRAHLEESVGRHTEALEHYRKFFEAWGDADPHLQHYVEPARQRVQSLQ